MNLSITIPEWMLTGVRYGLPFVVGLVLGFVLGVLWLNRLMLQSFYR